MSYEELVAAARSDDHVLGLVLTGSRGLGAFVRPESDWDVRLVVAGEALRECEERYETARGGPVEVAVYSLDQFEQAGEIGSAIEWDRYSYVHAQVVLDKLDGAIAALVERKGVLPKEAAMEIAASGSTSSGASSTTSRSWRGSEASAPSSAPGSPTSTGSAVREQVALA